MHYTAANRVAINGPRGMTIPIGAWYVAYLLTGDACAKVHNTERILHLNDIVALQCWPVCKAYSLYMYLSNPPEPCSDMRGIILEGPSAIAPLKQAKIGAWKL